MICFPVMPNFETILNPKSISHLEEAIDIPPPEIFGPSQTSISHFEEAIDDLKPHGISRIQSLEHLGAQNQNEAPPVSPNENLVRIGTSKDDLSETDILFLDVLEKTSFDCKAVFRIVHPRQAKDMIHFACVTFKSHPPSEITPLRLPLPHQKAAPHDRDAQLGQCSVAEREAYFFLPIVAGFTFETAA